MRDLLILVLIMIIIYRTDTNHDARTSFTHVSLPKEIRMISHNEMNPSRLSGFQRGDTLYVSFIP